MTPVTKFDDHLEQIIAQLALRILTPTCSEFESVWQAANRICDQYAITNNIAKP